MDDEASDNFQYHHACVRVGDDEVEQPKVLAQTGKRRKVALVAGKRRSFVWEHFDVISEGGKLHAQCKYCEGTNYRAEGHFGTSNCRRHLTTCKAYLNAANKKSLAKRSDCHNDFDEKVYCQMFADAIMLHDLPISIVEDEMMRKLHVYLNPKVGNISTSTIRKNVEALIAARKSLFGNEKANEDDVMVIKDSDADADLFESCSVLD